MNKTYFEILRAGVNTTIQDKGRNHLYHVGIAVSGAIDQRNYTLSNRLVDAKLLAIDDEGYMRIAKVQKVLNKLANQQKEINLSTS